MSKIESRCGLLCSACDFRETCNWGGKELVSNDPDGNIVMIL